MGALIDQQIPTLFHGISRQPDTVRLPGQLQEAENCLFSVVSGGFEKRSPTEYVATLANLPRQGTYWTHAYHRGDNEKYWMVIVDGTIRVYDFDGNEKTVAFPDGKNYLNDTTGDGFVFSTVLDFTFIVNRGITADLEAANLIDDVIGTVANTGLLPGSYGGDVGDFYAVGGSAPYDYYEWTLTSAATAAKYAWVELVRQDSNTYDSVALDVVTELPSTASENDRVALDATAASVFGRTGTRVWATRNDTTTVARDPSLGYQYVIYEYQEITAASAATYGWKQRPTPSDAAASITGTKETFQDLPASGSAGDIYQVTGDASELDDYFVIWDAATSNWIETADPRVANSFDYNVMPHALIRESDGTFTFQEVEWEPRKVGDDIVVTAPEFVTHTISDIVFHRNRITILADETVTLSQSGDYFNFWPDKATDVLDSDPISRIASSPKVNTLRWAVPFRRALFLTSASAQFELSSGNQAMLTPNNAVVDFSTAYETETECRPIAIGDELYFAARSGNKASVFEYYYDDNSISDTAADATIHVSGYIPAPIVQITGDAVTGTIWFRSSATPDRLYVYRVYWDGDQKAQQSWSTWLFPVGSNILGMQFIDGNLDLLVQDFIGKVHLERLGVDVENGPMNHPTPVLLDRYETLTGVYDAGSNTTTWTMSYSHYNQARVVLASDADEDEIGKQVNVWYSDHDEVFARGDYSGSTAIVGIGYRARSQFSKQYAREASTSTKNGPAITTGRLQLRYMTLDYSDTGYFEVHVTPKYRNTKVFRMTGRILGDQANMVGSSPIVDGTFKFPVRSRGDTATIEVLNDTPLPSKITRAAWVGWFNELTRQEGN